MTPEDKENAMKRNVRKLALNKETVRALQDDELKAVAGGMNLLTRDLAKVRVGPGVSLVSYQCPCPSTSTTGGLELV